MKLVTVLLLFLIVLFTPRFALCQAGDALNFNGTSDYGTITDNSINVSGNFTIEFWVNFTSTTGTQTILVKDNDLAEGHTYTWEVGFFQSAGIITFETGSSTAWAYVAISSTTTLNAGTWYHVAGSISGQTMKLYINGTQEATATNSIGRIPDNGAVITLGSQYSDASTRTAFLSGKLDEVRIWSTVRTAGEISGSKNSTLAGNTAGLMAYFKMSNGSGTALSDDQTNGITNDGTISGTTWTASTAPVPVELTSFTATSEKNGVMLHWNTATEINNYGFEIQRSAVSPQQSDYVWSKIGFVEGNGTINAPKSYSFTDKSANGKTSYRLKQIDRDGKFEYSQTVEVTAAAAPKEFALEQNYPNPFNPTTAIGYRLSANSFTTLKIYDAIGREVAALVNEVKDAGTYTVQFDGAKLSSGIYFARLSSNGKSQMRKLLLMK